MAQPPADTSAATPAVAGSLRKADSVVVARPPDTAVSRRPAAAPVLPQLPARFDSAVMVLLQQNRFYPFQAAARHLPAQRRSHTGKEWLFYACFAAIAFFGILRFVFDKYYSDLFRQFIKSSFRQKQIRDQLSEAPLPSMLFNILFVLSGGLYAAILLQYYQLLPLIGFWWTLAYATAALLGVYTVKYVMLKWSGWLFSISEITDAYIFIVFIINKLIGVVLLPFVVVLAFARPDIQAVIVPVSFTAVAGLLAYRYILSYGPVRSQLKISRFHFLLYLCAFEVAPLLLIYRGLLIYIDRTN